MVGKVYRKAVTRQGRICRRVEWERLPCLLSRLRRPAQLLQFESEGEEATTVGTHALHQIKLPRVDVSSSLVFLLAAPDQYLQ